MTELTTAQLLDQLNRFRQRNDKAPLKAWKDSKQKLLNAIAKEAPAADFEAPLAEIQNQQTRKEVQSTKEHVIEAAPVEHVTPSKERTQELKQARLENDRKNKALEEMEKAQPSPSAKRKTKAKVERDAKQPKATFSAAQIIMDFGIDPKQGRALLRKHNVAKTPEAVRAFFTARKKG